MINGTSIVVIKNDFLFGDINEKILLENDLQFNVNWVEGQKTGFFIDQRENLDVTLPRDFTPENFFHRDRLQPECIATVRLSYGSL